MCFNNCDPETNGEIFFLNSIKHRIDIAFDVGCRSDSLLLNLNSNVHYFEPNPIFLNELKKDKNNKNTKSFFNNFGLGEIDKKITFYKNHQSFINRNKTLYNDTDTEIFDVQSGKKYMQQQGIDFVDFLKIDTEGYEINVIQGFEDYISRIKIIQFEYGGTFIDANIKLIDIINILSKKFTHFSYLDTKDIIPIQNYADHYKYCNIVCFNKNIITELP